MKTTLMKVLFAAFSLCLLCSFIPSFVSAQEVSDIVSSLTESQKRELDTIQAESIELQKGLNDKILNLSNKTNAISIAFQNLSMIFENGSLSPNARSILTKQINELFSELDTYYSPLAQTQKTITARINQLTSINNNFKIMDSSNIADLNENLFSSLVWQNELKNLKDIYSTTIRTLRNDLPSTQESWALFLIRVITICIILGVPLYSSVKFTKKLPETVHNAWKTILKTCMPAILLGIAFYYGSLQKHTIYQIGMGISAILMCYGLIHLAFILQNLQKQTEPAKPAIRIFIPVLFASLALLTFTPLILTLSFIWAVILIYIIYYLIKTPKSSCKISNYILSGFLLVNIIGILITPNGLARLSILITLLYICLGVGIYLAFGIIRLAKIVQDYLQARSSNVFAYELAYAFLFPIVLLIAFFIPFTWIFAYPGGLYIVKNFSNFDFNFGSFSVNSLQIFTILIVFYVTKSIIKVLNNYIDNNLSKNKNSSVSTLTAPIKTTVNFGCWGLFLLYALYALGFSLTSITVVAGGLSVGIGLGLQSFVQNITSGFSLIFGQTIREGDIVDVAGISGVIQKISLRATQVRTFDNAVVFVPNSAFLSSTFTNWTHNGKMVRKSIPLGVAYGTDVNLVTDTVMDIVNNDPDVLKNPEPSILFMNFGASSLDFELRIWVADINNAAGIMAKVRYAINEAFKEKNIEIPFPQTDIHVYQSGKKE